MSNNEPRKMVAIEIGRVCKKLTGREAGRYCVVIDEVIEGYVQITGPRAITDVRRRQCNILHLEPLEEKLDIKKGASDEEISKALDKAGLLPKVQREKKHENDGAKEAKPKAEKKEKAEKPEKKEKAEKKEEKPKEEKPKAKAKAKKE